MKKYIKFAAYIPAIAMMIIIFWFSGSDANTSNSHSDGAAFAIISAIDSVFDLWEDEEEIRAVADSITHILRKLAHFAEYMVLCILWIAGLYVNGIRTRIMYIIAAVISIVYACTDEFHQLFVDGRYGSVTDVLIDSAGALTGCMLFAAGCYIWGRRKRRL